MNRMFRSVAYMIVISAVSLAGMVGAQQLQSRAPRLSAEQKAFLEKHKYTFELMRFAHQVGEIDKDKKYALTQSQAKKVLEILKPLRTKPKLTQEEAKKTLANLKKVFTAAQLNAMSRLKPRSPQVRRPEGRQQGPQQPPREQNIQRPQMPDGKAMQDFNPFYQKVPKANKMAEERAKRMNEFFASLEKKANPKKH
ncbi:MAG: hypothetical protein ACPL7O_01765 [Armatimonadota bacterium]